jgi:hypothetical protein
MGLNFHRAVGEEYLDFLKLIAGQIASRLQALRHMRRNVNGRRLWRKPLECASKLPLR